MVKNAIKLKKYKKNWAQIPFASRLPLPANARSLASVRFANSSQILPSAQLHAQRSPPPPVTIPPTITSKIRLPPVKKKYFYNKTKLLQPKKTFLLLMLSVTVSTMATAALNLGMWKISENISSSSLYLSKRTKSSFASEPQNQKLR